MGNLWSITNIFLLFFEAESMRLLFKLLVHGLHATQLAEKDTVSFFKVSSEIIKLWRWLNVCLRVSVCSVSHFSLGPCNAFCVLDWRTSSNPSLASHSFFTVIKVGVHIPFDESDSFNINSYIKICIFYRSRILRASVRTPSHFMSFFS